MKILVIHTGGTILCKENSGILSPESQSPLIESFKRINGSSFEFNEEFFSAVLSENIDGDFYACLINHLAGYDFSSYDGVIITHGTDTLSYSASLVSMCLRHISVPIAFVSSNYIVDDERSNAQSNFDMAVRYFASGGKGFVVPYENNDSRRLIHLATRLLEADSINNNFQSLGQIPLAEIIKDFVVGYDGKSIPSENELSVPKEKLFSSEVTFGNKILMIKGYPDIDLSAYDFSNKKPSAILFTAFHSGTASSKALPDFIKKCKEQGIDFYLSPCKKAEVIYESTQLILKSGAMPIFNTTVESALAKLKIKYNIKDINVNDNLYFEMI